MKEKSPNEKAKTKPLGESASLQSPKIKNLSPTKIADQFWCEMQLHLRLLYGMEPTEVMLVGAEIHRAKEEELGPVIEVKVETRDDEITTFILQFYLKVKMLLDYGLTREMPVIGEFDGLPIIGIIDQLEIAEVNGEQQLFITDYKTRKSKRVPTYEQKRRNNIQLQVYWHLLNNLLKGEFTIDQCKEFFGLEDELKPSENFIQQLPQSISELLEEKTPEELLEEGFRTLQGLPPLSEQLQAIYLHQKDQTVVHHERTFFHQESFEMDMQWAMSYWRGKRKPNRSPQKWMCNFCPFTDKCEYFLRDYLREKEEKN